MFFLSPGILWAFKKPILFLPFHAITSVSYTSVLQRTFNLVINAQEPGTDSESEIEFAMLDQADFAAIDAYIKRHGLNDASLADSRRAKVYNVNAPKGVKAEDIEMNGVEPAEAESELQRAERELQDKEDEEEEDYVDEGSDDGEEEESEGEEYAKGEAEEEEEEEEEEGVFEEEQEFDQEAGGYEDEG
jgi:hypothetical protein